MEDAEGTAASTVDELDEAESSMADDDLETELESAVTPSGSSGSGVRQSSHADPGFPAAWQQQLRKPGLLGALVAAAYPDRIAQLKTGGGSKPSYTLSTGRRTSIFARRCSLLDP
jgi:hypothetical protein